MLQILKMETSKRLTTLSKYTGLGAAMVAELMNSFWFGVGVILAIGVSNDLNYYVGTLMSGSSEGRYH